MITVEKLLFPGIGLGCLFLVLATSFITKPNVAKASTITDPQPSLAEGLPTSAALIGLPVINMTASNGPGTEDAQPAGDPAAQEVAAQDVPAAQEVAAAQDLAAAEEAAYEEPVYEGEDCSLGGGFPDSVRQWCEYIDRYATEHGLDPNLVAAVMVQESGGNPQAYSKDGAVGLMQVMPRDGKAAYFQCINGPCFADRPSTDELFNPEFNVAYGSRMLAGLIQKKGSVRDALRAYGPMNMGYYYADLVLNILNRSQ